MTKQDVRFCIDPDPNVDTGIFRIEAADDILRLLVDAHETEFTIPELVDATDVARGEAARQSDIDLFVVVDGDRTTARRTVEPVVADLQDQRFDGDRFVFEPYVESTNSAQQAESKLREIFLEGITVYEDEKLHSGRKEALSDE